MMHAFGKLAYFAMVGFMGIVLVGPVVGVVGALLPFAAVGLAVYGIYHGVRRLIVGKQEVPKELVLVPVEVKVPEPIVEPVLLRDEVPTPGRLRRVGRVIQEMFCGAVVAGAVAAAFCWQTPGMGETISVAVAAGAVVGFVVGGALPDSARGVKAECSGEAC